MDASPIHSSVNLLGTTLVCAPLSFLTGGVVKKRGKYLPANYAGWILMLIASCMLGALILHRIMRAIPAVTRLTPDWESWSQRRFFPFGLALSGIVVVYLVAAIWPQV